MSLKIQIMIFTIIIIILIFIIDWIVNNKKYIYIKIFPIKYYSFTYPDLRKFNFNISFKKPILGVKEDILTLKECKHLIEVGKKLIKPSEVGFDGQGIDTDSRSSSHGWIDSFKYDSVNRVTKYLSKILNIPKKNFESWQIVNYKPGQEYKYHTDSCNPEAPDYLPCLENEKKSGKRLYTAIIYLNDNYDEGETEFTEINEKIKGKTGSMVIFQNILNNKTNKLSTHAGLPPKNGEKWIINVWIRDTKYR